MADISVASPALRENQIAPERAYPTVEHGRTPEPAAPEQVLAAPETTHPTEIAAMLPTPATAASATTDRQSKQIELILETGLGPSFQQMNAVDQNIFKAKGEEVARKITILLAKPKVQLKKIIALIRDWLKMIPGVNKFFVEQTAKIKADEIIELKNRHLM